MTHRAEHHEVDGVATTADTDGPGTVALEQDFDEEHLALIYRDRDEQLATAARFIRQGLEQGEQCLYIADDNTTAAVVDALDTCGVDVEAARRSGALSILDGSDTYLETGEFDRDAMVEFWELTHERVRASDEFDGLRAAAEMTWALDSGTDLDALARYESHLNTVYDGGKYTVLCQYNRDRFPQDVVSEVLRTHPLVVHGSTVRHNGYYEPPGSGRLSDGPLATSRSETTTPDSGQWDVPPSVPPAPLQETADSVRVLYVDDSPGYADMAADFLELDDEIDTVVTETDPSAALRRLGEEPIDCVVSDYEMPDIDGLELFDLIRDERPTLPFVLVTGKGDEAIASEAISAGVTDYFRKQEGVDQYTVLANRISNAVTQHRKQREIRQTRRQYKRLVESSTDVITVLDGEGRFVYVSPAAERRLGHTAETLVGESGFERIHPEDRASVREQFGQLLERPDEHRTTEFRFEQPDGSWLWLEARWRNLLDDPDVGGIIMYARDVTDRKERERALRESENRFRSLFEKAFDAMVIADDTGEYVDANPAACELFELSREELIGRSITAFAPEDYDFEAAWQQFQESDLERGTFPLVGAEGTERVVEFAATPNIVPGQHLSVLRDVTDREQYAQTLTALHDASQDLLGADSTAEVADCTVAAGTDLLSMSTVVVYLFDPESGQLQPAAASEGTVEVDSLTPLVPDRDTVVGSAFLDGESERLDAGRNLADSPLSGLPLCSGVLLPVGDHGVCVIGDTDADLTDNDRELAHVLTATAQTALDRVEKEQALRDRTADLRTRNEQLERLNRINATIRDIDETLVQADTREEVERAVCQQLSGCDGIASVWIGERDPQHRQLVPQEWSGDDRTNQYLDSVSLLLDVDTRTPATLAATTGEPVHVENTATDVHGERWRKEALSHGFRSALSIPITYKDISYGTVSVYAEEAGFFSEVSRMALQDLSNKIANALNAIEHQNAVLTESTTEVTLHLADEGLPLHRIAARTDCSLTLEGITQQAEGNVIKFLSVEGADLSTVTATAEELTVISGASIVTDNEGEGVVSLRYSGSPLTDVLADRGIRVPEFTVDAGSATITLLVPDTVDLDWIFETFEKRNLDPELVAKTQRNRTDAVPGRRAVETFRSKLTPRQQEVLRTAYLSGFFQSPRECTGEELAEHLDISPQTVYRHIRTAERKLFETVFDDGVNSNPPSRN